LFGNRVGQMVQKEGKKKKREKKKMRKRNKLEKEIETELVLIPSVPTLASQTFF